MTLAKRGRVGIGLLLRVTADALLVNLALIVSLLAHYLWVVGIKAVVSDAPAALQEHVGIYLRSSSILTPLSVLVFALSGFYTHSRLYQGRYKAIVITQAVSVTYLLMLLAAYLLPSVPSLYRSVYLMSWGLTLSLLLSVRLGPRLWKVLSAAEKRYLGTPPPDRPIRNVLVIGGAGYIGSALIPKLLERDILCACWTCSCTAKSRYSLSPVIRGWRL
jgi:FlaA1/EpsC-like NDP-sugar epimerase